MHNEGYVYPNERVEWGLMIVMYPCLTGIVAGAFVIASLYYAFKIPALKPVAKLSLLVSLVFLCIATTPLLLHLGQPTRSFLIMIRPNLRSAMAIFGYVYTFFMALLLVQIWFTNRSILVSRSKNSRTAIGRLFYSLLALGVREIPEKARNIDKRIVTLLGGIGIPAACILTGYVGFIFAAVKANAWWSTPLTPLIFVMSGVASGTAAVILIYFVIACLRREPVDPVCMKTLIRFLWGFLIAAVSFELVEVSSRWYEHAEEWPQIELLMTHTLRDTFVWGQFIIGSGVTFLLLAVAVLFPIRQRLQYCLAGVASLLVLFQVLCMRWNVVIGGQLLSKTGIGFHKYHLEWGGKDGILMAILVFVVPLVFLCIAYRILPPFEEDNEIGTGI